MNPIADRFYPIGRRMEPLSGGVSHSQRVLVALRRLFDSMVRSEIGLVEQLVSLAEGATGRFWRMAPGSLEAPKLRRRILGVA